MIVNEVPIHFFTIVLNGMPFIPYHLDVFRKLPFRWHWHIVEGVAKLVHDTAWSVASGGHIPEAIHEHGRSKDGTSAYLDQIAAEFPSNISIYRKPLDSFWEGKREMVAAPLAHINEPCLLWQVDADELWLPHQIAKVRQLFIEQPHRTAAFYWCDYFVGPNAVISTRYNYAQNPQQEWLRTWRYMPGARWKAHEPPILVAAADNGEEIDIGKAFPFYHDELEAAGVTFQHFAYATEAQVRFKEDYYGYKGAVASWQRLQNDIQTSVFLRDYFPWVTDATMVDKAIRCGVRPLTQFNETGGCHFMKLDEVDQLRVGSGRPNPQIVIDGVFFQVASSGIARVWRSLLAEWSRTSFRDHVVVLDRHGTAPRIPGIRYRSIPEYASHRSAHDSLMLQRLCDELRADLFVSTYYTTPTTTPALMPVYDMIPEVTGLDLQEQAWQEKELCIRHADSYVAISESTRRDLIKFYPQIESSRVEVVYCGVDPLFSPPPSSRISSFRRKYGIDRPYFLLVGERMGTGGYKNASLLFKAFAQLDQPRTYAILCVGGAPELEPGLRELAPKAQVHCVRLTDEELCSAYGGAIALVFPSRYEGFGMPVIEAMAAGCPVITCRNSSLGEISGDAVCYVDEQDPSELCRKLVEIQESPMREQLVQMGLARGHRFSWTLAADQWRAAFVSAVARSRDDPAVRRSSAWTTFRKVQDRSQRQEELLLARIKRFEEMRSDGAGPTLADVLPTIPGYNHIAELNRALRQAHETVRDMQRSPFWKLRIKVISAMQSLGVRRQ